MKIPSLQCKDRADLKKGMLTPTPHFPLLVLLYCHGWGNRLSGMPIEGR